jgi:hypothetical protein
MSARFLFLYCTATNLNVDQAQTAINLSQRQGFTLNDIATALGFADKL